MSTNRTNVRALTNSVMAKPAPKVDTSGDGSTLSSRLGALAGVLDNILSKGPNAIIKSEMIRSLAADLTNASIDAHRMEAKISHHHAEKAYWMREVDHEKKVDQAAPEPSGPVLSFKSQTRQVP